MKYMMLMFSVVFLLISCGTENKTSNSTDSYQSFELNDIEFVEQFNQFISDIKKYSEEGFNDFITDNHENSTNTKLVYLFGEHHLDIEGKKRTFALISNLAQKSPVLVLDEGGDASDGIEKDNLNKLNRILSLFLTQKYAEINAQKNYDATKLDKWVASHYKKNFSIFFKQLNDKKINLGGLALKNMSFGNWDSREHRAGELNFSKNVQRNRSMLGAINKHDQPITVVIAGFFHVPLGEHYLSAWREKKFSFEKPINYESYYSLAESTRTEKQNRGTMSFYDEFLSSTEVLYRGLKDRQWNFIQAIPKSSLKLWESQMSRKD